MKPMTPITPWFVAFAAMLVTTSRADMIFDIDFENPPHSLGSAPATGGGSDRPTTAEGFVIGTGVADFTTQVALMETNTVGGSMTFFPPTTSSSGYLTLRWELAMLVPDDSENTLQTVLQVSRPSGPEPESIVHVNYSFNGGITVNTPESGSTVVGTWTLDAAASYELVLDLDNDTYDFLIDGSPVVSDDPIGASTVVNHAYFQRPFGSPSFAIDNVQWAVIPEPATAVLWLLGALGLAAGRPKRDG